MSYRVKYRSLDGFEFTHPERFANQESADTVAEEILGFSYSRCCGKPELTLDAWVEHVPETTTGA